MTPKRYRLLWVVPCDPTADNALRRVPFRLRYLFQYFPLALSILDSLTPDEFERTLLNEYWPNPGGLPSDVDLVAISFLTASANRAYAIADHYRRAGIPVVLGGIHVSAMPDEAARHADAIVVGEAEEVWPVLLEDFRNSRLQRRYQAAAPPSLVGLARHRWNIGQGKNPTKTVTVQASRGCPYQCDFCSITAVFGHRVRTRPIAEVIDELEEIRRQRGGGRLVVVFKDDNIAIDRRYAMALFEALKPLRIFWYGQADIRSLASRELLDAARDSGCVFLTIGLESCRPDISARYKSNFPSWDEIRRIVRELHQRNIGVWGSFMFGFDEDEAEVFDETVKVSNDLQLDFVTYCIRTPFPGTALYAQLREQGRLLDSDWKDYDLEHVVFRPRHFTPEQLTMGRIYALQRFYSFRGAVVRSWRMVARTLRTRRLVPFYYHSLFIWAGFVVFHWKHPAVLREEFDERRLPGGHAGRAWDDRS